MYYIEDQHIIDLKCIKKILGSFKEYAHSKILIFELVPSPCSSLFILHVSPNPIQHIVALVSYPTPSQKKFQDGYEFLNEKSGSEKKENIFFFGNSTSKMTMFFTRKSLKKYLRLFNKEHFQQLPSNLSERTLFSV